MCKFQAQFFQVNSLPFSHFLEKFPPVGCTLNRNRSINSKILKRKNKRQAWNSAKRKRSSQDIERLRSLMASLNYLQISHLFNKNIGLCQQNASIQFDLCPIRQNRKSTYSLQGHVNGGIIFEYHNVAKFLGK